MKNPKTSIIRLAFTMLAFALASGSAHAGFVLVFDDPDTPQEEFRIEDEGPNDTGAGIGNIQFNGTFDSPATGPGEFVVGVTALSKDFIGTRFPLGPGFPDDAEFTININLFTSKSGRSMTVRLTDTGYSSSVEQADAYINTALGTPFNVDGAESIQFTFYGDTSDAEFGNSFVIGSSPVVESPDDQNLIVVSGAAAPIGSLTMETTFIGTGLAEGRFTQVIAMVPGSAAEPVAPTITTQPESTSAEVGDTVEFQTAASGTSPLSYQWIFKGADLAGEIAATLTVTNVQLSQAGDYQVLVNNAAGSDLSSRATLTVTDSGQGQPPTFTLQPVSQQASAGDTVSFSVTATGTPPLSYSWQYNGNDLPGERASILTLEQVQSEHSGSYQALVSNSFGSEPSEVASLIVVESEAPTIVGGPDSQTVDEGDDVEFTVVAVGSDPLSYQWYYDGAALFGETGASLLLTNVQTGDAGSYRILVSNAEGIDLSPVATLTVNVSGAEPPTITDQPNSQSVDAGDSVTFSVTAIGTAPLAYQWYRNGAELSGKTSASFTLDNVQVVQAGTFTVLVENPAGSEVSEAATLTVGTQPTVIVDGTTVMRIENLPVPDQWDNIRIYDVDFVEDSAINLYGSDLVYDLVDEDAALGLITVNETLNATLPIPDRAGPDDSLRYYIGAFTEEIFVSAVGSDYSGTWGPCDSGCIAGVDVLDPNDVHTWAQFTIAASEPEPATLVITNSAPGEMTIFWSPDTFDYILQENTNLTTDTWIDAPSGSANPATGAAVESAKFFRLRNP